MHHYMIIMPQIISESYFKSNKKIVQNYKFVIHSPKQESAYFNVYSYVNKTYFKKLNKHFKIALPVIVCYSIGMQVFCCYCQQLQKMQATYYSNVKIKNSYSDKNIECFNENGENENETMQF